MRLRPLTLLLLTVVSCSLAGANEVDPLLASLSRAKAAHEAREASAGCFEFDEVRKTRVGEGIPTERQFKYRVARKPGFVRIYAKSDKGELVYCENPTYTFAAVRKGTDSYRLGHYRNGVGFGENDDGTNPFGSFVVDYLNVVHPMTAGFHVENIESPSSTFTIDRTAKTADEIIVYGSTTTRLSNGQVLTHQGTTRYDSNQYLVSSVGTNDSEYASQISRTYRNVHPDGGPFTDWSETTIHQAGANLVLTMQYRMLDDPLPSDQEFFMAHYGLPEPIAGAVISSASPSPYFWVIAVACVVISTFVATRMIRNRHSALH